MVRLGAGKDAIIETRGEISIPVWYDWGEFSATVKDILDHISIPVWYDWGG